MEALARTVLFAAGFVLVVSTLLSAVRTVILPRAASSLLTRSVFWIVGRVFRALAGPSAEFSRRDRVLAMFSPVTLLMLPAVWLTTTLIGYMAMYAAVEPQSIGDAFFVSGSSLFTLGFALTDTAATQALAFTESMLGLALLALLITFLPTLYAAFSRRENKVALLEVRAGSPPSAVTYLLRYQAIGWLDQIGDHIADWEGWFADIEESHRSYPALTFLRAPQPDRSWITAAGTVLDTASLVVSTVDLPPMPQAQLTIRAGYIALRRIADYFGLSYPQDPQQGDPISIARPEFDQACAELREAGVPLKADLDQAWIDFAGWRVNYDTPLLKLAELVVAPYAPWTSDRSAPDHEELPTSVVIRGSSLQDDVEEIPGSA